MTLPKAWPRIAAFLLDYLLILVYLGVLALVGLFLTLGPLGEVWSTLVSTPARRDLLAFFMTVFPVTAYFVLSKHWEQASEKARVPTPAAQSSLPGGAVSVRQS